MKIKEVLEIILLHKDIVMVTKDRTIYLVNKDNGDIIKGFKYDDYANIKTLFIEIEDLIQYLSPKLHTIRYSDKSVVEKIKEKEILFYNI